MIPKEQLTAYQRWEMASFDEAPKQVTTSTDSPVLNEDLTAIREQARHEAYAKGLAEGYQTGHSEGLSTGLAESQEQTAELIKQLTSIAANFTNEISQADNLIAAELLDLAMEVIVDMASPSFWTSRGPRCFSTSDASSFPRDSISMAAFCMPSLLIIYPRFHHICDNFRIVFS